MAKPNRSEVWLVDLGMAAKVRPCLVLSVPFVDRERALVTLIPHTTSIRDSRFEVRLSLPFLKPGAFDCQNLITVPVVKLIRRLGRLKPAELDLIEDTARSWLGLRAT